jgi:RNA polymerase sigma-70 factor (ECF subfamily)
MSDVALARRLVAGEEPAFDEFFAEYFPRLFRFASARLDVDADLAEEAVQTTLIRALQRIHTYRGEAALFTWLCTICRHEVSRLRERTGRAGDVDLVEERPDTRAALETLADSNPEAQLHRKELARLVQVTLDHLPHRYGDVLEWKYIDGVSVSEIAGRLGLGYKAAESLLERARRAFREGFQSVPAEGA